ncbi:reverse transcriptase domain-containing protein [Trichonephila inaurata madagascariensis]|uniref:Reverse transcriptase domain-containing protein n=1 Tax=Trichonephila inaurata madagascariensis TaxID=2747483 RepID=A0A8X6X9Q6_9ARAC|nr:reverse transcriptase domain-containing protein [Trichonephila inaurata madagascariensis]
MISFEMKIPKSDRAYDYSVKTNLFNTKRANWNMFYSQFSKAENAILDSLNNCIEPDSLELCVHVQELITSAAEKSIPLKKSGCHKVPWWSIELFCMHKQLNAARRRYQRTKNSVLRAVYREIYFQIRIKYKFKLHESKLSSWKSFLADITVQNVWKKIYTYEVKTNFTKRLEISGIEVSSGNFTSSFEDTIDAVLRKSFPCDPNSHDNSQHRVLRYEAELVYESDDDVPFSRTEIDCVIDNLSLNKSPGFDRINSELVKKFHNCSPSVLLAFFNNCLNLGVFPKIWKRAKIVLLPKSTELSRTHIENIRCISLLPCLGKCLEKLCITRLNHFFRKSSLLSDDQKPITLMTYTNEVYQEYKTVCFTDGRKLNGRVGLARVIYEEGVENFTFQHRLRDE